MKEELEKLMEEYKKEEEELLKEYPLTDNKLSNNHPINNLTKQYMEKKKQILEKYGTQ